MLRKPVTYTNIDGQKVTEDYYFHLTKAEVIELQVTMEGGLAESLEKVGKLDVNQPGNAAILLRTFKDIIKASFGRRTPNGGFVKREEDWEEFSSGEAYSELFMEMISDGAFAAEFVRGILPEGLDLAQTKDTTGALAIATAQSVELPEPDEPDNRPLWMRDDREPTQAELTSMPREELLLAMQWKNNRKREGV